MRCAGRGKAPRVPGSRAFVAAVVHPRGPADIGIQQHGIIALTAPIAVAASMIPMPDIRPWPGNVMVQRGLIPAPRPSERSRECAIPAIRRSCSCRCRNRRPHCGTHARRDRNRRSPEVAVFGVADADDGDFVLEFVQVKHGASLQNPTRSPPFSFSISRASAGVAISRLRSSRMRRIFATCSAFDFANWPLPM